MEAVAPHHAAPADSAPTRRRAKKLAVNKKFVILGAVALVIALAILAYEVVTAGQETTDDAQIEADVVTLAPRVGGPISQVLVHENQQVKKGQLLVVIDESDYQAKLAQAEAELATAKAQAQAADAQVQVAEASAKGGFSTAKAAVSGSSVGVSTASAQIAAARAQLAQAQANEHKAQLDLNRAKQLRAVNAIPQQQLDDALVGLEAAHAQVEQAKAGLQAATEAKAMAQSRVAEAQGRLSQSQPVEEEVAAAHAQAELAHARVLSAQAALTLAQNQLSYTHVVAPTDGELSSFNLQVGEMLQPGQSMGQLVPDEKYVVANFKETQITKMHPGDRVDISVDAYSHEELHGRVQSLSGGTGARFSLFPPDNASGNFVKVVQRVPVRIELVDPPKGLPLKAGLSADVTVHTQTHHEEQAQR
jgi:membrane fusion protein (multidrug efflux system)